MPTRLEDVVEANEVRLDVGIGVGDAIANTCLGGEVDDYIEVILLEKAIDSCLIGNVALYEVPRPT